MKSSALFTAIVLTIVFLTSACSTQAVQAPAASATPTVSEPRVLEDQGGLLDALRAAGANVEVGEPVEQAFFKVAGQIIKVNGQDVQVFEYESAEKMEGDAAQVAADGGSIGTSMVTWVEPPHFFKSGRVLVLYVGQDKGVISLLKGTLGEQFAGQ